jgi:RHS repeat-associated protein
MSSIAWSAISTPLASSNGGSLQYSWPATQNNGQITQMADTISGETVTYQYDALKRLVSACSSLNNCTTAPTTFQYDGFGNLTSKTLAGVTSAIPVNAGTNQLSNAFYDANGNMTSGAGVTLTYDVANRVRSASPTSGGTEYYGYAADNKRMWRLKLDGATEEWTLYGKSGERIGVYQWTGLQEQFDNQGNWTGDTAGFTALRTSLWFDGRLMQENGTWVLGDRLGTNRAGGARFLPYGEETSSTANDRTKFASYNRDGFTGLDYADQRYYASTYGRFNTPDPYAGSAGLGIPSSWNRYMYVLGDPVNLTDVKGLYVDCDGDDCSEADDCDGDPVACSLYEQNAAGVGGGVSVGVSSDGDILFGIIPVQISCWSNLRTLRTLDIVQP